MANLDNFDRPWGVGPVSRCVVPGAEVRQVNSGSEYKSPVEKVGGGHKGSGLAGLHMKHTLTGKSRTASENWLALGKGSLSRVSKAPEVKTTGTHSYYNRPFHRSIRPAISG